MKRIVKKFKHFWASGIPNTFDIASVRISSPIHLLTKVVFSFIYSSKKSKKKKGVRIASSTIEKLSKRGSE